MGGAQGERGEVMGVRHGQLQMEGTPTQKAMEERLDAFMLKQARPCLGCGARKVEQVEPYAGHGEGCSLVAMWRKHGG